MRKVETEGEARKEMDRRAYLSTNREKRRQKSRDRLAGFMGKHLSPEEIAQRRAELDEWVRRTGPSSPVLTLAEALQITRRALGIYRGSINKI
jgi:hypothetical protein